MINEWRARVLTLPYRQETSQVRNQGAVVRRWLAVAAGDLQMAEAEMPLLYVRVTSRCQEEPRE